MHSVWSFDDADQAHTVLDALDDYQDRARRKAEREAAIKSASRRRR